MTGNIVERLRTDLAHLRGISRLWRGNGLANHVAHKTIPNVAEAADTITMLEEALRECSDDLEAELKERWSTEPDGTCHPALQHKFNRDMATVNKARQALNSLNSGVDAAG